MNILYVTPYVPTAIFTRPRNLIRSLVSLGHRITLLTAAGTSQEDQQEAAALRGWGIQVELFPVSRFRSLGNCLRALPTPKPLQSVYAYHPEMAQRLGQLLQIGPYDLVHIEHLRASQLVQAARQASEIPVVYDSVDCISKLFEQALKQGAQLRSRLMAALDLARTRRYEAQLLTRYDHVVVTSQRDQEGLEELSHRCLARGTRTAPITVVPNGVDLDYFRPGATGEQRDRQTVVFTGKMSYHANVAAVLHFSKNVLPHIWARNSGVRFLIVGKNPPNVIRQLGADERIVVTGTVDDVRPFLGRAAVAVCPAVYAAGIQNKVLEAMAMGTPVVSTSAGSAALKARAGQDILVADEGETMAAEVLRLLADPALAERLSAGGREYVEAHHSWTAGARQLEGVYRQARADRHS